jgi:hypothetical protein
VRNRRPPSFLIAVICGLIVTAVGPAGTAIGSVTCTGGWTLQHSARLKSSGALQGVTALSPADAWAVGWTNVVSGSATLAEHWDGSAWQRVQTTTRVPGGLLGVSAAGSDDVWAVGTTGPKTITEHWDGTTLSAVPSPSPSAFDNVLNGVAAVSPTDVWSAGYLDDPASGEPSTFVLHWDGSAWARVSSPNAGRHIPTFLYAISAASANDIWAVGWRSLITGGADAFAIHWDGTGWHEVAVPSPTGHDVLYGVSAISASDVWAVGQREVEGQPFQPLVEHWDGSSWSVVDPPPLDETGGYLFAVSMDATDDGFAVGYQAGADGNLTLVEHWDGSAWSLMASPSVGKLANDLYAVSALSPTTALSVGEYVRNNMPEQPLVEQLC